ncbi:DUF4142 domain-containing protein [Streptomyces sp. NPDC058067]|uniref:DUF4142 domain-containing protein n=1 Tax=Streptomyces sp. NPDC058067 TaxID=3346324 RepID=UPI0036E7BC33
MRRTALRPELAAAAGALLLAVAVSACGSTGPSASALDSSFLKTVHQGNLAEIAAGKDAQRKATRACTQKVGEVLVRDHTALDAGAEKLAAQLHITLPKGPTTAQQQELSQIDEHAGTPAYDAQWLAAEAAGHQDTLTLIDHEIAAGRDPKVTAAARQARPVVARHLSLLRSCLASASPSASPGVSSSSP